MPVPSLSLSSTSFLAPKHRTSGLSLNWVTIQQKQMSGKTHQRKAQSASPRSQDLGPGARVFQQAREEGASETGEAGLAV